MNNRENVNGEMEKISTIPMGLSKVGDYSDLKRKEHAVMSSGLQLNKREENQSSSVHTPTSAGTTTTTSTPKPQKRTANDFRFGKTIGEGSFSTVYLAEDIHSRKEYAIKVCDKQHIIRERKTEYIKREREVLNILNNCPGIVNLYCTFQDQCNLYFVMTYAKNGDLLPYINKVGSFDLDCTRFYAAEIILALEQMHCRGIIHRDLKPENILMDEKMHVLLADFGSAKIMLPNRSPTSELKNADSIVNNVQLQHTSEDTDNNMQRRRKNSFVGTAQYVSPELLNGQLTSRAADLWALGCIIYQMISGLPPFRGATEYLIFQKVLKAEMSFPDGFDKTAENLVQQLIHLDPRERIGMQDISSTYESLRRHPFFDSIDWETVRTQSPPPIYPYLPGLESEQYRIPDYVKPGLGEEQLRRLIGMEIGTSDTIKTIEAETSDRINEPKSILDITDLERARRLEEQAKSNKWHPFAEGELILKQGFVNKRKGLFARKRMLLLTTGPRLIYIDSVQMVKKGEIPWSSELHVEPKNFKIFFVHTPNRTYYLEDSDGYALNWCKAIDDVRTKTYGAAH